MNVLQARDGIAMPTAKLDTMSWARVTIPSFPVKVGSYWPQLLAQGGGPPQAPKPGAAGEEEEAEAEMVVWTKMRRHSTV